MIRAFILSLFFASLACAGQGYVPSGHVVTFAAAPTCSDGIQNGDETGIDCGGSCTACVGGTTAPTIRNSAGAAGSSVGIPQPVSGNIIVVFGYAFSSFGVGNITDSAGNAYTLGTNRADANGNYVAVYTAPVTSTGSGTLTISSAYNGGVFAAEIAGAPASSYIDGTVTSGTYSGSAGGLVSAASITTTVATDIILSGAINQNSSIMTANTGTSLWGAAGADYNIAQHRVTSSTGGFVESFNVPASSGETAAIVAIAIKGQ